MDLAHIIPSDENKRALVLWNKLQMETLVTHWYAFLCHQEEEEKKRKSLLKKCKKPRKKRSCWTRDWVCRKKAVWPMGKPSARIDI